MAGEVDFAGAVVVPGRKRRRNLKKMLRDELAILLERHRRAAHLRRGAARIRFFTLAGEVVAEHEQRELAEIGNEATAEKKT